MTNTEKYNDANSITLAVPYYNGAAYLPGLLSSLNNLTHQPDEILFIDDGSTDNSFNLIDNHYLIVRHERNRGLSAARNTAIHHSMCDIILFIDVDTSLPQSFINQLRSCYHLYPNMAGIGGRACEMNTLNLADRYRSEYLSQSFGEELLLPAPMLWGVCSSYRRRVLLEINGFNEKFSHNGEDVELGIRLNRRGYTLLYHPELRVEHHKVDTDVSLMKTVYRWIYWGAKAYQENKCYPLPGIMKKLTYESIGLLLKSKPPKGYKKLCTKMLMIKNIAVFDACIYKSQPRF